MLGAVAGAAAIFQLRLFKHRAVSSCRTRPQNTNCSANEVFFYSFPLKTSLSNTVYTKSIPSPVHLLYSCAKKYRTKILAVLKCDVIFGQQKIVVVGAALVNITKFSYPYVKMVLLLNIIFILKAKKFEVCANASRGFYCAKPILL